MGFKVRLVRGTAALTSDSAMANLQQTAVKQFAKLFPDAVFYKPVQDRLVALTIDDVPTPTAGPDDSTGWILDAIATHKQSVSNLKEKVQVTFFIIGSHIKDNGPLLASIAEQGHEIGNHGFVDHWTFLQEPQAFEAQFKATHEQIQRWVPGQQIRWYRPGRAFYNSAMVSVIRRTKGYEPYCALASMLPLDTLPITANPRLMARYIPRQVFPGAILVLHGGSPQRAQNTAQVLPALLRSLQRRDYRAVTLSELWQAGESQPQGR